MRQTVLKSTRSMMRRGLRRPTALVAALLTASLLLGACGSSSEPAGGDGGGVGTEAEPVVIRMITNEAFAKQWQDDLIPEFNKTYPHIQVEIEGVPYTELLAKSMLDLTAATPNYDVVIADDPWTPQLAATGGLMDLKNETADWTEADYAWDDFYPAALASSQWDGKQYGVPLRSNLMLMFYNKQLYEKAGLDEPTPELTWQTFKAEAPKLVQDTDGDGKDDSWATGMTWARDPLSPTVWQSILNANGGALFDDKMNPTFDSDEGVAALQTQIDLIKYAPSGSLNYSYNEPLDAFRQGKIASIFTWGSAFRSAAVDPEVTTLKPEDVGIQTLPAGSAGPSTHRGIWSGSVPKRSAHPQAAWTLLQWMSSKEGETWATNNLGSFPARKSTLSSTPKEAWMAPVFDSIQDGFQVAEKNKMWRPRTPKSNEIQEILAVQTSRAVTGEAPAQAALDEAAEQIAKLPK